MTAEQRQRAESLFHEALELPEDQREIFLAGACPDDAEVREESLSLVLHFQSAGELSGLRPRSAGEIPPPSIPERIGDYTIISHLGRGGMGEVYLARDPRLGRKVAIKVLSAAIAGTPGALDRLRREALSASALNHPNILTVYEFSHEGELQYIVSEFVEGRSLRELIGQLSLPNALDYARQIGEALAAAHRAGIIHRDVKPENVMVRPDGYIKLLDFGLAKVNPPPDETGCTVYERISGKDTGTTPGLLIGTVNYMSPEQIRSQAVDRRTDIWNWGVVLYEMVAGRRPFMGETPSDVLAAILDREPEPLAGNSELQPILRRAMAKKTEDRYSDIGDALRDLAEVPAVGIETPTVMELRQADRREPNRHLRWWGLALAMVIALAAIFARPAIQRMMQSRQEKPLRVESLKRLTNRGDVTAAAISADGNYVIYTAESEGRQSLRIFDLNTDTDIERFLPGAAEYKGVALSDGFIYYVSYDRRLQHGKLFRMPVVGGEPTPIADDVDFSPGFSADHRSLAFLRNSGLTRSLVVHDLNSGAEKTVPANGNIYYSPPLLSSDGGLALMESFNERNETRLVVVRTKDGKAEPVPLATGKWILKPAWLVRDKKVVLPAGDATRGRAELIQVSIPSGQASTLLSDLTDYSDVDSTADGKALVAIQKDRISAIWIAPFDGRGAARMITAPGSRYFGVSWTPEGKLISQTENAGRHDLVLLDTDSGRVRTIAQDDYVERDPAASPDGRYIIYSSNRDGAFHLWRSNADGTNPVRLTSDSAAEIEPAVTPDSRWIVYTVSQTARQTLRKVPMEGGPSVMMTDASARRATVSPDGKFIACLYRPDPAVPEIVAVLRADDGGLVTLHPGIPVSKTAGIQWSNDGKYLLYSDAGAGPANIRAEPARGGTPRKITRFETDQIYSFAISKDGKWLACVRGRSTSDAVFLKLTDQ